QFVLVDRERFQNVQSPFNGPDAIAAAGAHAKPFKTLCVPCVPCVSVCPPDGQDYHFMDNFKVGHDCDSHLFKPRRRFS
ncbi:hypothetical protein, partial [Limnohabitans sp.]|uniref:hypothetical protein n=1 Tax=Limnohabitans sp. TaxID=1907725 RepID=UPI0037BFA130